MGNPASLESPPAIDHRFLDTVEQEIQQALARSAELEAGLEHLVIESNSNWQDSFEQLSSSLTRWEKRLDDLSKQTAAVEVELQRQESALREWFAAMGATRSRLSALAGAQV
jgi:chromosome segregation ATPase